MSLEIGNWNMVTVISGPILDLEERSGENLVLQIFLGLVRVL